MEREKIIKGNGETHTWGLFPCDLENNIPRFSFPLITAEFPKSERGDVILKTLRDAHFDVECEDYFYTKAEVYDVATLVEEMEAEVERLTTGLAHLSA